MKCIYCLKEGHKLDSCERWPNAEKEKVEKFAKYVLNTLKLNDWEMKWEEIDPCGFCYNDLKHFTIPPWVVDKCDWVWKEYVLHEVAHIFCKYEDQHGPKFYRPYIELLRIFMLD